jgi:hypothetical protein
LDWGATQVNAAILDEDALVRGLLKVKIVRGHAQHSRVDFRSIDLHAG